MVTVAKYRALGDLPGCYTALFREAGQSKFFVSLPWFKNFERTVVGAEEHLWLLGAQDSDVSDAPVGLLPLWKREAKGLFSPRVIQGLSNYYSPYLFPLIRPTDRVSLQDIVGQWAAEIRSNSGGYDKLELRPLDPSLPSFGELVSALERVGFVVQTYFYFGNWYLDVQNRSFEQYVASLGSTLRKNIPYQTRRLQRTYRTDIVLVTGKTGLDRALDDYEKVYRLSWRDREEYPGFIRGLAHMAADEGGLRLAVLYADEVPIAAQFWIVYGGVASIYKICYDERFAKFSVGTVLTSHVMRHVLDVDKVTQVDYLSGDDSYKRDWMSHRREFWGILAFNPRTIRGLLQIGRHVGGRWASRFVRSMKQAQAG